MHHWVTLGIAGSALLFAQPSEAEQGVQTTRPTLVANSEQETRTPTWNSVLKDLGQFEATPTRLDSDFSKILEGGGQKKNHALATPKRPLLSGKRASYRLRKAITINSALVVRKRADESSPIAFVLAPASLVKVEPAIKEGHWYLVTATEGEGYTDDVKLRDQYSSKESMDEKDAEIKYPGEQNPAEKLSVRVGRTGPSALTSDTTNNGQEAFGAGNYRLALSLFRRAADSGSADDAERVGFLYESGLGVSASSKTAFKWYLKAAELGNSTAMNQIGLLYRDGRGVSKNMVQAVLWLRKSADLGNPLAFGWLGYIYLKGEGVAKDCAAAQSWLEKAAHAGDRHAANWLKMNKWCSWTASAENLSETIVAPNR